MSFHVDHESAAGDQQRISVGRCSGHGFAEDDAAGGSTEAVDWVGFRGMLLHKMQERVQ